MRRGPGPIDFWILLPVLFLVGIGIIMVFSASALTSADAFYYFKRQLLWAVLGIVGLLFFAQVNYRYWRQLAVPVLGIAVALLFLVLLIGNSVEDSSRWLSLGPLAFQPSEFIKPAMVIFLASSLTDNHHRLKSLVQGIGPYLALLAGICLLIVLQPDLGTAVTMAGIIYLMLTVAGTDKRYLFLLAVMGLAAVALAVVIAPYRMARFTAFLDPWADPQKHGFQTIQSLMAIGSGGLFGSGFGQGRQKLYYVPENHTDFIFSILSEELGFIGVILVIMLFLLLIWRGINTALKAPDTFGSFLAAGLTIMIGLQTLINMGVVTGMLPVTGITLPFLSYGGSSLIFTLLSVGILLNISRYAGN